MQAQIKEPNPTAKLLGYAGLIPFLALSAFQLIFPSSPHQEIVTLSLIAYGATIASFLGAIHWGFAMQQSAPNRKLLLWGVIPSLLGWISLVLGSTNGLLLLVATLWLCFVVDYKIYPKFELAPWLSMRFILTAVACISLSIPVIYKMVSN
jgi:hypothetical protein